jgi:DNA adenine methylase
MHYLGSKARHAAEIIAITCANRRPDQVYVEPFVGGGNMINKVPQGAGRIANDKNYGMVALLDQLGNHGWVPPETMTQAQWKKIMKQNCESLDQPGRALFAFAATGPTFGSMWCGQWAKDYPGMEGTRYRQARDAALKDAPGLAGIQFHDGEFHQLEPHIPHGSLVYCDPPYNNTTEYSGAVRRIELEDTKSSNLWKASKFWKWCDHLIDDLGCSVFVSEYSGPEPGVYSPARTDEQKAREAAARVTIKALQDDPHSTGAQIEAAAQPINDVRDELMAQGAALAARWKVVWSKEVISDFSASRGKEEEGTGGKRETECLFHRES